MVFDCRTVVVTVTLLLQPLALLSNAEWPRFRGPNGTGVVDSGRLPVRFGPDENVVWKTELPPGHSSPVLTRDFIFLTAVEEDKLFTLALDRDNGHILWRREASRPRVTEVDNRNNAASPSPVVDDSGVYVFFPDVGLLSYDFNGELRWEHFVDPFDNIYGMGASPIVADDKIILVCDQSTQSYVVALDKYTGEIAWKVARPRAKSGHSTPVLYRGESGILEVIVPGSFLLTSYAVETGQRLWWVSGLSFEMKSTPVLADGMIFINGYGAPENQPGRNIEATTFDVSLKENDKDQNGLLSKDEAVGHVRSWFGFVDLNQDDSMNADEWDYYVAALASRNGILGIRVGGEGDMTSLNTVWTYDQRVPQLPSPLLYGGILYMVNDSGIVTLLDPKIGSRVARGRLKGAIDNYYASPVAADDKIFMASELGKVAVLKPGRGLDVLAVNDLDDLIYATPAIADGRIYIRTRGTLYCFGSGGV